MKILWVTKYYSKDLTGGTRVSYNYIQEFKKIAEVEIYSLINHTDNKKKSLFSYYNDLLKLSKNHYDYIFFDDHFSFQSFFFKKGTKIMFYHGNWPQLIFLDFKHFIKGLYLFPLYLLGMLNTDCTIFVNPYYQNLFKIITNQSITLLNPVIRKQNFENYIKNNNSRKKLLLVGNIDSRKYKGFVQFLEWERKKGALEIIHYTIFGKVVDQTIAHKLLKFGVEIAGYKTPIPYQDFDYQINFSEVENMPLSMFESLVEGVPCIFPKTKYYESLSDISGLYLYADFDMCYKQIQSKHVGNINANFIPKSYIDNINILIEFFKNKSNELDK